jgi:hypothetical protein
MRESRLRYVAAGALVLGMIGNCCLAITVFSVRRPAGVVCSRVLRHVSVLELAEYKMSIRRHVDQFLKYCTVERQLSENTLQAYFYDLADFQKWLPSRIKTRDVKTDELRDYLEDMISGRQLSVATVRRRIACLRAFFRYFDEGNVLTDPFIGWRLKLPRRKRLPRALSQGETVTLIKSRSMGRHDLSIEIGLMIATGIPWKRVSRPGRLCNKSKTKRENSSTRRPAPALARRSRSSVCQSLRATAPASFV